MDVEFIVDEASLSIGFSSLWIEQETALLHFLSKNDTFVCLPTGYRKSLCYTLLPLIFDRLNLHVSPSSVILVVSLLVSLIKDHVRALEGRGISAVAACSDSGVLDDPTTRAAVSSVEYKVVYTNPDVLLTNKEWKDVFQSASFQTSPSGLNCVKKWLVINISILLPSCVVFLFRGTSFRKEFSKLGEVHALLHPNVRIMALTATASKSTRKDICRLLGMHNPSFVFRSSDKPNITYCVS